MKKIFFVGKFNETFQEINRYLGQFFSVQICMDDRKMIKEMMSLNCPDLILVSLMGLNKENMGIVDELFLDYFHIPMICIEGERESGYGYFSTERFRVLPGTIRKEKILENICELLGVSCDTENGIVTGIRNERKLILLVDDSAVQLRTLKEILKKKYDVQMATSGSKALTLIGKRIPDIIFLDYEMPVCDGKMTLEMIRELDEAKDIPVVFLTGVKDKEHIEAVLSLNPAGYLLKPAKMDMLYEILNTILGEPED